MSKRTSPSTINSYLDVTGNSYYQPFKSESHRESIIKREVSFFNCSDTKLAFITRDGVVDTIQMSINGAVNKPAFIKQTVYYFKDFYKDDLLSVLNKIDYSLTKETAIASSVQQMVIGNYNKYQTTKRIIVDEIILIEDIKRLGGTVYSPEMDVVITTHLDVKEFPLHPYSAAKQKYDLLFKTEFNINSITEEKNLDSSGVNYFIIDNSNSFADRYINVKGNVHRIPIQKSLNKLNGVYCILQGNVISGNANNDNQLIYASFEEADKKFGLHLSYASAADEINNSTLESSLKSKELDKEILSLKHAIEIGKTDIEQKKQDLERFKQEFEKSKLEWEKEKIESEVARRQLEQKLQDEKYERQLEREKQEVKMNAEKQAIKDEYEERSMNRKNYSEALRHIPAIILGVVTAVVAIKSFMAAPK